MPKTLLKGEDIGFRERYIECDCHSPDHVIRIVYYVDPDTEKWDDEEQGMYIETQLDNHNGFFKRVVLAFKYVFGLANDHHGSHWATTEINMFQARRIRALCDKLINDRNPTPDIKYTVYDGPLPIQLDEHSKKAEKELEELREQYDHFD